MKTDDFPNTSHKEQTMSRRERAQLLLNDMAVAKGMDSLTLDERGYCALGTSEDLVVHLHYDEDQDAFLFMAALGEAPDATRDAAFAAYVYARLMEANLFWDATLGATLACERSGYVVVQQLWPVGEQDATQLARFTERFADLVAILRERYAALPEEFNEPNQPFGLPV